MSEGKEYSKAMPSRFYRDPVECVDERRKITVAQERQAERDRLHKGRRIRALVKQAKRGEHHGI